MCPKGGSQICTHIEREFLRTLEGGCTAPIGAYAKIIEEKILFKGILLSLNGTEKIEVSDTVELKNYEGFGKKNANFILSNGGAALMQEIKNSLIK